MRLILNVIWPMFGGLLALADLKLIPVSLLPLVRSRHEAGAQA
jgi:uncharacterized membrane protein YccF (DUF307 family)